MKWIVAVCGVVLVFVVGVVGLGLATVTTAMKRSDAYKGSLTRARSNPALMAELGSPIEPSGFMIMGSLKVSGAGGTANISYSVAGPKGKATIYVDARKFAGRWEYNAIEAVVEGSSTRIRIEP